MRVYMHVVLSRSVLDAVFNNVAKKLSALVLLGIVIIMAKMITIILVPSSNHDHFTDFSDNFFKLHRTLL